jgi:uncharacterized protein YeaO (DUF488 family)
MLKLKRAYDAPARGDGWRVLVERLWPRGVRKEELAVGAWLKDLAPSTELRKWFGHDPERWPEFERRYRRELERPAAAALVAELAHRAAEGPVTLVYAARDTEHNSAVVLRDAMRPPPASRSARRSSGRPGSRVARAGTPKRARSRR